LASPHTSAWTVPTARFVQVLEAREVCVVDLRSPGEFAADHAPGALNIPLFDDLERALVGTLFKQRSPQSAFDEGREIVVGRIEALVAEIAAVSGRDSTSDDLVARVREMTAGGLDQVNRSFGCEEAPVLPGGALVICCWRGGLRSSSVVALLRSLGWQDVFVLAGGYKGYRTHVLEELEAWCAPPAFVLRGCTGVGKTLVLREIERCKPNWTLDLEGLAGHRSSILGMVGLEPCSQKLFDSRMSARLRAGFAKQVVLEGESRKVGDVIVPRTVWEALDGGTNLYLVAPMEYRIGTLLEDYLATTESRTQLRGQLPFIEARLGQNKWSGELVRRLDDGREAELVEILLERYYDPLYQNSEAQREYTVTLDASDVERVAGEVIAWIEERS